MSITHAQLREFAYASEPNNPGRISRETSSLLVELGLFDKNGITPAGRDAIATVPYLVDATPVEEAPTAPETVECSACDGQGVKRIAHVYELRDYSTGKLTQHTRGILVVCDAKSCERGRVATKPVYDYCKDRKLAKNPWRVDPKYVPFVTARANKREIWQQQYQFTPSNSYMHPVSLENRECPPVIKTANNVTTYKMSEPYNS